MLLNNKRLLLIYVLILLLLMCLGMLIGNALGLGIGYLMGVDNIMAIMQNAPDALARNKIRIIFGINNLFSFVLPALVFARILYKQGYLEGLQLNKSAPMLLFAGAILVVICALPMIQTSYILNKLIPLPESIIAMEEHLMELTKGVLKMDGIGELLLTLLVVAVIPGISEELFFRGSLQPLLSKAFHNQHLGVWITAFVFSLIHFQFQGFIPRLLSGALLGYLLVYGKSLWLPIVAHAFFNGSQVIAQYIYKGQDLLEGEVADVSSIPWLITIISAIFVFSLFYFMNLVTLNFDNGRQEMGEDL